ncbi:RING-H2 finger protein ATL2-like [Arachis ipaensis]|uniref:RING-H2 finger protein ATL2-like n=1 Tax=Arachis ipaensis TaxID=130454 RepID=UPI000A2B002F|nr:RING-H2 finger protein ATL2-like [Arachis ipaensis]XP_025630129.1 RING-H2 finger protein ATL2-like [Arachis hypogaea]
MTLNTNKIQRRNIPTPELLSLSISFYFFAKAQLHRKMDNGGNANKSSYDDINGKIMLISIIIVSLVLTIMICFHIYARLYLRHSRQLRRNNHSIRRNAHHHPHFVFYVNPAVMLASRGLDASVIASLPVFTFSRKTHPHTVDCPVCLSEFEEGETGRVLPTCNHTFHTECIDMWFHSHSTCPLCRAPVETPKRPDLVITVGHSEPGSSFQGDGLNQTGPVVSPSLVPKDSSSIVNVSVEVPARNEDYGCQSPSSSSSFRSPVGRMKRILSREQKASTVGCSSTAEEGVRSETQ